MLTVVGQLRKSDPTVPSLAEFVDADREPIELFTHLIGLSELDRTVYRLLLAAGGRRDVDAVADEVGRNRTTVYRSLRRLVDAGLVERHRVGLSPGGYRHEFHAVRPGVVADAMERQIDAVYARMGPLVMAFRDKYGGAASVDGATGTEGADGAGGPAGVDGADRPVLPGQRRRPPP